MAYPIVNGPYGLLPQNLIGGQVFAGSTRMVPIASGYGTGLYYGDVVQIGAGSGVNAGAVIQSTMTYNTTSAVAGTVGIFLGCSCGQQRHNQQHDPAQPRSSMGWFQPVLGS